MLNHVSDGENMGHFPVTYTSIPLLVKPVMVRPKITHKNIGGPGG